MSRPFTPRKKKPVYNPPADLRPVRVDTRTVIFVSASIPEDVARQRYLEKHQFTPKPHLITQGFIIKNEGLQEKPVGTLEDIEQLEKLNKVNEEGG